MSLRLSWKALLAIACCVAVPGCAPFRPWAGSKAAPGGGSNSAHTAAATTDGRGDHLDRLINEPKPAQRPKPAAKSSLLPTFGADSSKKDAAQQAEIESDLALARLGERRGQSEGATQLYRKIAQKYPHHPAAYHRLGVLFARENNFNDANECFEYAAQLAPPSLELLSDLGYCYYLQSRYDEAEQVLRHALKQKPNHESSCNNLGLVLGAQGRYADALEARRTVHTEETVLHRNESQRFVQSQRVARRTFFFERSNNPYFAEFL
jgi:tetratricopeptide (TPR) repeat protein